MEIPGQYTGLSKPIPDTHIKITSFDAMILIMGSLRKPKRLKIHGNDERDYPFLVKGGEDLRLDQRVQQLFSVMNQILLQDNAAAKRSLKIKTYQVQHISHSPAK
jgi:DNA-dependent protein kinase catalytic subunit